MEITHELVMKSAPAVAEMFRAEGKASVDLEKVKAEALESAKATTAEAVKAEKERISGILAAFDGTNLVAEAKTFIDEGKTVVEAQAFALAKMKEAGAKHLQNLNSQQPNVPAAPAKPEGEEPSAYDAGAAAVKAHLKKNEQ